MDIMLSEMDFRCAEGGCIAAEERNHGDTEP